MKFSLKSILALLLCLATLALSCVALAGCDNGGTPPDPAPDEVAVTGISLNTNTFTLTVGDTYALTATIAPSDATDKSVTWSSSNPEVVTVSDGLVTAVSKGVAVIIATSSNGKTAMCTVTVEDAIIEATGITLNTNALALTVGDSFTLTATVAPSDATDKSVAWSSSNPAVATVDHGLVTAVSEGTTTITVATANGKTATCTITVNNAVVPTTSITLNKTEASLPLGNSLNLIATVLPENATDKTVTWHSSDETVAKVVNGAVTPLNIGTATITATAANGMTAQCVITITGNAVIQYEASGAFYIVTGIEGRTDKLEIPFLHDGARVIAIKAGAFAGNTDLKEITLPNSINHIYANAFKDCSNLTTINLPESLTSLGESAFENCASLKEVTIPSLVETISTKAFYGCTALKTLTTREGVKQIGTSAFANCTALEDVTVENGLETIGTQAFYNCSALKSFVMPNTVKTLGNKAFQNAESLTSVTFSTALTSIGFSCFQSCVSLDHVELHDGITALGDSCFSWCSGMKNLRILGDITSFGNSAFYECTGLENVYFASSIPGDLGLNNYIFYNAGMNGKGITFTLSPDGCIPERLFEPQSNLNRPNLVKLVVEEGATKVNYFLSYNTLPYLTDIILPDTIVSIEKGCFDSTPWWNAQADGAVYLGNIFYGYKGTLTGDLEIPNNVVCIAKGALAGQSPTSLVIPYVGATAEGEENTHFGYIFGATTSANQQDIIPSTLTNVTVKNCQYTIEKTAFDGCTFTILVDHHWGEWNTTLAETCQTAGEEERVCSVCELVETRVRDINPDAHATANEWTKDEHDHWHTCTNTGCTAHLDLTSHTWGEWVPTLAPTCQTTGSKYHLCTICNYKATAVIPIEPENHNWNDENTCSLCSQYRDEELHFTFDSASSTYSVTSYTGSESEVIIPSVYKGYAVTHIGEQAFFECSITSVTIPSSVTSIGTGAFASCYELTSIIVDGNNPNFSSIDGNLYSKDKKILMQYACGKTDSHFTIPSTVVTIDARTFADCSLTSITIPDSVNSIGELAFDCCYTLTSITIPNSVTSIGAYAFECCSSLTTVIIGSGVTSISEYTFVDCSSLTSVTIGNGVTSIGTGAFSGCSKLTSITIPYSVANIGACAFESCSSLTSITIPNSVTSIGEGAFSRCSSLESITLPFVGGSKSATTASKSTLFGYIFGTSSYTGGTSTKQYYSSSSYATYYIPTSLTSVTITGGKLLYGAFYRCSRLTSVTIGNGVTSIGDSAFYDCSGLTSITIPNSVTSIGNYVFCNCSGLTSITIPEGVTSIGAWAFAYCPDLTSITIPEGVTSIGDDAFYGCSSLTSITIPNSVTSIGAWAFYNCSSLTSVYYHGTATEWSKISIDSLNSPLTSATCYYYSEEPPTDTTYQYWHYVDDIPTKW